MTSALGDGRGERDGYTCVEDVGDDGADVAASCIVRDEKQEQLLVRLSIFRERGPLMGKVDLTTILRCDFL